MSERPELVYLADIGVLCPQLTREHFRAVHPRFILRPTLSAPVLVFEPDDDPLAEQLRERIRYVRERLRRVDELGARKRLVMYARKAHEGLIALATGYTYAGSPTRFVMEFTPDLASAAKVRADVLADLSRPRR